MGADGAVLTRDLTEPEPIPEAGIARAVELMRSGRLFRYGETGDDQRDVALLESEFAAYVGRRFCVACNSGGGAMFLALKVLDVAPGDAVLVNGFTLAPVPGAIAHAGARPVVVEIGPDYVIDVEDLRRKAVASGAKVLLLSHMRGHLADMDAVTAACRDLGLRLVEDCAHALGAAWNGRAVGSFGEAAVSAPRPTSISTPARAASSSSTTRTGRRAPSSFPAATCSTPSTTAGPVPR